MISALLCVTTAVFFAASILMMIVMAADSPNGAAVKASMWTMVGSATLLGGLLIGMMLVQAATAI